MLGPLIVDLVHATSDGIVSGSPAYSNLDDAPIVIGDQIDVMDSGEGPYRADVVKDRIRWRGPGTRVDEPAFVWSRRVSAPWPATGRVLRQLAESYSSEASFHDMDVARSVVRCYQQTTAAGRHVRYRSEPSVPALVSDQQASWSDLGTRFIDLNPVRSAASG